MKGHRPPRPAQSECKFCTRLFVYFQTTKRRTFCSPCADIKRTLEVTMSNDLQRRMRFDARENARSAHA